MSNRVKFMISLLFIVAIILCVGLTKFYYDVSRDTGGGGDDERIAEVLTQYSTGLQLFRSTDGYYGLLDKEGAVVIEPEWTEILAVTPKLILASQRMDGQVLIGGIDYEENVVLPFVFQSMEKMGDFYYLGVVAEDGSNILYDSDTFVPVFSDSWTSVTYKGRTLTLSREGCTLSYYANEGREVLQKASMETFVGGIAMEWEVTGSLYLAELKPEGLQGISSHVTDYMEMLLSNDFSNLSLITSAEYIGGLSINDSFNGAVFDRIRDVAFTGSMGTENRIYDLSFTIEYHTNTARETISGQSVQVHLYFQKTPENKVILTSVNMDFHNSEPAVTEPEPTDAE